MNELSRHHVSRGASRRGFFVLATVLFFVLRTSPAEAGEGKLPPEQRRQLETVISRFMAANSVPGISAAAVVDGQEAWSEGFGRADLENNVPVTPQTLFRLGSVSKSITATATMHLWEQGKLDLDAPLQQYCPQFPKKEWPISTRQILGHLGGIRHYRSESEDDLEINNTKHFDDPIAGGIQFFANDPLVAKPGTKFRYSTQGFTLVGCAIEGASREKYVDYVEQNVLRPAGMSESRWDDRYAIVPHRTRFYSKSKSGSVVPDESTRESESPPPPLLNASV